MGSHRTGLPGRHGPNGAHRIDAGLEPAQRPMQVRPSSPAGGADKADALPFSYFIPQLHQNLVQMDEGRGEPVAMVKHDDLAGEEHALVNQGNDPARRRFD